MSDKAIEYYWDEIEKLTDPKVYTIIRDLAEHDGADAVESFLDLKKLDEVKNLWKQIDHLYEVRFSY